MRYDGSLWQIWTEEEEQRRRVRGHSEMGVAFIPRTPACCHISSASVLRRTYSHLGMSSSTPLTCCLRHRQKQVGMMWTSLGEFEWPLSLVHSESGRSSEVEISSGLSKKCRQAQTKVNSASMPSWVVNGRTPCFGASDSSVLFQFPPKCLLH